MTSPSAAYGTRLQHARPKRVCLPGNFKLSNLRYNTHNPAFDPPEDFDSRDEAYFAVPSKGRLQSVFERHAKEKAGNLRHLLTADEHSSHVNLRFIDYSDKTCILLVILLPHSTHRLQPLESTSLYSQAAALAGIHRKHFEGYRIEERKVVVLVDMAV